MSVELINSNQSSTNDFNNFSNWFVGLDLSEFLPMAIEGPERPDSFQNDDWRLPKSFKTVDLFEMQKGYMVVTGVVHDPTDYMKYVEAVVNLVNAAGGQWLVRNPESDVREGGHGHLREVTVI